MRRHGDGKVRRLEALRAGRRRGDPRAVRRAASRARGARAAPAAWRAEFERAGQRARLAGGARSSSPMTSSTTTTCASRCGSTRGPDELVEQLRELVATAPDVTTTRSRCCDGDGDVGIARQTWTGTFGGSSVEMRGGAGRSSCATGGSRGRSRFEPDDLDGMLARFDELRGAMTASRVLEEYVRRFETRDWDALSALYTDDFVLADRRHPPLWESITRDELLENLRHAATLDGMARWTAIRADVARRHRRRDRLPPGVPGRRRPTRRRRSPPASSARSGTAGSRRVDVFDAGRRARRSSRASTSWWSSARPRRSSASRGGAQADQPARLGRPAGAVRRRLRLRRPPRMKLWEADGPDAFVEQVRGVGRDDARHARRRASCSPSTTGSWPATSRFAATYDGGPIELAAAGDHRAPRRQDRPQRGLRRRRRRGLPAAVRRAASASDGPRQVLDEYLRRYHARDWDGLRELYTDDFTCVDRRRPRAVGDRRAGRPRPPAADSPGSSSAGDQLVDRDRRGRATTSSRCARRSPSRPATRRCENAVGQVVRFRDGRIAGVRGLRPRRRAGDARPLRRAGWSRPLARPRERRAAEWNRHFNARDWAALRAPLRR